MPCLDPCSASCLPISAIFDSDLENVDLSSTSSSLSSLSHCGASPENEDDLQEILFSNTSCSPTENTRTNFMWGRSKIKQEKQNVPSRPKSAIISFLEVARDKPQSLKEPNVVSRESFHSTSTSSKNRTKIGSYDGLCTNDYYETNVISRASFYSTSSSKSKTDEETYDDVCLNDHYDGDDNTSSVPRENKMDSHVQKERNHLILDDYNLGMEKMIRDRRARLNDHHDGADNASNVPRENKMDSHVQKKPNHLVLDGDNPGMKKMIRDRGATLTDPENSSFTDFSCTFASDFCDPKEHPLKYVVPRKNRISRLIYVLLFTCLLIGSAAALCLVVVRNGDMTMNNGEQKGSENGDKAIKSSKKQGYNSTFEGTESSETILAFLERETLSSSEALSNPNTLQGKALSWLIEDIQTNKHYPTNYFDVGSEKIIQRYVLAAFYFGTSGDTLYDSWSNANNWLSSEDECQWHGISCDVDNKEVTKILLHGNNLNGYLPEEIQMLTKLITLDLSRNHIHGDLPVGIGKLFNLKHLLLGNNKLSGELSNEINKIVVTQTTDGLIQSRGTTSLEVLRLDNNHIFGMIPLNIFVLQNLIQIDLSHNNLQGSIPDKFEQLMKVKDLILHNNSLDGSIPTSIAKLEQLEILHLGHNRLGGIIPHWIDNLPSLETLCLNNNRFEGSIPKQIGYLVKLGELRLEQNFLEGDVPSMLCDDLLELNTFSADCLGPDPVVVCPYTCCTECFSPVGNE